MSAADRKLEIAQLSVLYGSPARRRFVLNVSEATVQWWTSVKPRRQDGEVVLFIRRRNGNMILHIKDFYPAGALRVPSGGIQAGESLSSAVYREALEETGLETNIERFLAVIEFEFHCQGLVIPFSSYLFLLHETGGQLQVMDKDERIAAFVEAPFSDLLSIAERLENVPPDWHDWGQFRALPHRVAAELLQDL
nr:NUDIX hydrolase [Chloroflexota bacterium]